MSEIDSRMCDIHAPVPSSCQSGEVRCVRGEVDLEVIGDLVVADIINLCPLPAQHVAVDCVVDWDDLGDTGAGSVGLTDDGDGVGEDEDSMIPAASAVFSTAGMARLSARAGLNHEPVNYARKFGIKVTAVSTAGAGKIGMTLYYRAAQSYSEIA